MCLLPFKAKLLGGVGFFISSYYFWRNCILVQPIVAEIKASVLIVVFQYEWFHDVVISRLYSTVYTYNWSYWCDNGSSELRIYCIITLYHYDMNTRGWVKFMSLMHGYTSRMITLILVWWWHIYNYAYRLVNHMVLMTN